MKSIQEIKGVIPALLTVFDEHEEVDEQGMRDLVRFLLKQKVNGLYLTGSTGEGFLMKDSERKRVVEIVIDEVKQEVPIIVHVGAISTKRSIELAQHAYESGADAISSVPPFYWKFSEQQIFDYYADLSRSTPLPMIVYNVPLVGLMGVNLIAKMAKEIEQVKGVKYTASTHYELGQIKEACGKEFMVYSGSDEMALSGMLSGSDGLIGSFYNVIADLFIRLYQAYLDKDMDLAVSYQQTANAIIMKTLSYGSMMAAMKVLLRNHGVNAGYVRRPFNNFSVEEEKRILSELASLQQHYDIAQAEIFDYVKSNT